MWNDVRLLMIMGFFSQRTRRDHDRNELKKENPQCAGSLCQDFV